MDEPVLTESEQTPQRRWPIVLGYVAAVVFFVLATRLQWTPAVGGLFWAAVVRGVYVAVMRRRDSDRSFISPWLFALAGVFALLTLVGQNAREQDATDERAVELGVVSTGEQVSPLDRCRTKALDQLDEMTQAQRAAVAANVADGDLDAYMTRSCSLAESLGALAPSGDIRPSDEFQKAGCVDSVITNFDAIAEEERAFSRSDFEKFADRYCDEAIRRDLVTGSRFGQRNAEIEALGQEVLTEMVESGEITEIQPG